MYYHFPSNHFSILAAQELHATIKSAKSLIEDPKHWVQGTEATDLNGIHVPFNNSKAVCFCAIGAVKKSSKNHGIYQASISILNQPLCISVSGFNDTHEHSSVMGLFADAIKRIEDWIVEKTPASIVSPV